MHENKVYTKHKYSVFIPIIGREQFREASRSLVCSLQPSSTVKRAKAVYVKTQHSFKVHRYEGSADFMKTVHISTGLNMEVARSSSNKPIFQRAKTWTKTHSK